MVTESQDIFYATVEAVKHLAVNSPLGVCALCNRYFYEYNIEIWFCLIQLIAFQWDMTCIHSSPDPSLLYQSGSGL